MRKTLIADRQRNQASVLIDLDSLANASPLPVSNSHKLTLLLRRKMSYNIAVDRATPAPRPAEWPRCVFAYCPWSQDAGPG
jgi:hypothetical protein